MNTSRLTLQPLTLQHANDVFDAIDKNRNELREWLPFVDYTKAVSDTEAFIKYSNDKSFAIFFGDVFCGLIGLKDLDQANHKAEIGYWISPPMQNKGFVTEACKAVMQHAFNELNVNRLQIKIAVGNKKSLRVAEKLGFIFEGIERDGELLLSGYTDLKIFSMLKKDFSQT